MASTQYAASNSQSFYVLSWLSFSIAFIGSLIGIYFIPMDIYAKAFLGMAYLFSISACFMVAKVVRDKQESGTLINKIEQAKTEKLINKYVSPDLLE